MSESRKSTDSPRSGRLSGRDPIGRLVPPAPPRKIRVFTSDHTMFEGDDAEWVRPADPLLQEDALRHVHSTRTLTLPDEEAAPSTCASCREEIPADLNYRLVLRCTSPAAES